MQGTVFAVQFFNWYWTARDRSLAELEKEWTYRPAWGELGIAPEEIGHGQAYYERQFAAIRDAGFDAVMWEWHNPWPHNRALLDRQPPWPPHGGNLPEEAVAAAQATGLRVGMFYDLEIRCHSFPGFVQPTPPTAELLVRDIAGFYGGLPAELWLRDREGRVPVIVYAYQFASGGRRAQWEDFFRQVVRGVQAALGGSVVLHWTDAGLPVQAYAFQHVPEIRPFTFNPCHPQSALGPDSVTFVLSYDDYGVWRENAAKPGVRAYDLIIKDPRLVEETLSLARATDPSLVFFYGWNELYEGEALLPDEAHGRARLDLACALIRSLRAAQREPVAPQAVLVADDLEALAQQAPEVARQEIRLLQLLRPVFPGAQAVCADCGAGEVDAELAVYVTVRPPQARSQGKTLWLWPASGLGTSPPGVVAAYDEDAATCVRTGLRAAGLTYREGPLFAPHHVRVARDEVRVSRALLPTRLPPAELPVDRYVLVAARALEEETLRLPSGWEQPEFSWLRGTPRPLAIEQGTVRLRYPEVVEVRR